jgi:hypothetical protein
MKWEIDSRESRHSDVKFRVGEEVRISTRWPFASFVHKSQRICGSSVYSTSAVRRADELCKQ